MTSTAAASTGQVAYGPDLGMSTVGLCRDTRLRVRAEGGYPLNFGHEQSKS